MRVLLDTCVWGGVVAGLRAAGHDVIWSGQWKSDPGDQEILARAYAEQRVFVTLDKDFGELAIVRSQPHSGIVRLVNWPASRQTSVCLEALERYGDELAAGALVTAEPGRWRVRPASAN